MLLRLQNVEDINVKGLAPHFGKMLTYLEPAPC